MFIHVIFKTGNDVSIQYYHNGHFQVPTPKALYFTFK